MAVALGIHFLNQAGMEVSHNGAGLEQVDHIDLSNLFFRPLGSFRQLAEMPGLPMAE